MLASNEVTAREAPREGMTWMLPHTHYTHTH